jgi:hypothetical protein
MHEQFGFSLLPFTGAIVVALSALRFITIIKLFGQSRDTPGV